MPTATKMGKKNYDLEIEVPQGINISLDNNLLAVKGTKGEVKKEFNNPRIELKADNEKIDIKIKKGLKQTKTDKTSTATYYAHIRNMLKGAANGYSAKLKICSGHFPMTVNLDGNKFSVKNFLGEKVPRAINIKPGVKVEIQGDTIKITGVDKDLVGQTAANIEQLTRITNRDRRIFQDGIYILEKPGEE